MGCRHFDCASFYGNEVEIGIALRKAFESGKVKREDLYITSKCWNDSHRPLDVIESCKRSLENLGLEYLDLYLIHWPVSWKKGTLGCKDYGVSIIDTWKAMEILFFQGRTKALGVSNFGPKLLKELLAKSKIKPSANQLEIHPFLSQPNLVKFCNSHNIQCIAWAPISFYSELVKHPAISSIAEKRGLSPCQVILKWNIQRGVAVIPQSSSPSHIKENLAAEFLPDFSPEEISMMGTIDQHRSKFPDIVGVFEDTPFFPYHLFGHMVNTIGFLFWTVVPNTFTFSTNPERRVTLWSWKDFTQVDKLKVGILSGGLSLGLVYCISRFL